MADMNKGVKVNFSFSRAKNPSFTFSRQSHNRLTSTSIKDCTWADVFKLDIIWSEIKPSILVISLKRSLPLRGVDDVGLGWGILSGTAVVSVSGRVRFSK